MVFVRLYDLENQITAGFGFFLSLTLIIVLFIHLTSKPRFKMSIQGSEYIIFTIFALTILIIYIIQKSVSVIVFVGYVREYFIPFLLLFVFVFVFNKDVFFVKKTLLFVIWPASIVGVFNIYHYLFGLDVVFDQFVMGQFGSSIPEVRSIFGFFPFPRLNHILGLGTQGGGGVFYIILSLIGIMLRDKENKIVNYLLVLCSVVLCLAAV